jgi:hypothetical protein
LLVRASNVADAREASSRLHAAGIDNRRIVYLPMRGTDTPTPKMIAEVAAGPFQSMTCLTACGESPRFVSISARRTVARCSYTIARRTLASATHAAMLAALAGLELIDCADDKGGLVKLGRVSASTASPDRSRA